MVFRQLQLKPEASKFRVLEEAVEPLEGRPRRTVASSSALPTAVGLAGAAP